MRIAYADPPYPGQARRKYGREGDPYDGDVEEVDHGELIERLGEYDGWALSTSMVALRSVLPLTPASVVVAVWVNTNAEPPGARKFPHHYCWEPVLVSPARPRPDVKNVFVGPPHTAFYGGQIVGQKHNAFAEWVFRLIGSEPGDEFHDLFPGSGAIGSAWESYGRQIGFRFPPIVKRSDSLRTHPVLEEPAA